MIEPSQRVKKAANVCVLGLSAACWLKCLSAGEKDRKNEDRRRVRGDKERRNSRRLENVGRRRGGEDELPISNVSIHSQGPVTQQLLYHSEQQSQ